MPEPELFAEGFAWPEAPRWHGGRLWISDAHNFRIATVSRGAAPEAALAVPGRPAGMDFAANGDLLFATALEPRLCRLPAGADRAELLYDLAGALRGNFNDMLAGPGGWAWVGDTGFTFGKDTPVNRGRLIAFHPALGWKVAAEEVFFPNGMALGEAGELYLCETFGKRISRFVIGPDGQLAGRSLFAELPGHPDGLCRDAEGCLWVPLLFEGRFLRLDPAGRTVASVELPGQMAISCTAAGPDPAEVILGAAERVSLADGSVVTHGRLYALRFG